jgi:hypothetical protein
LNRILLIIKFFEKTDFDNCEFNNLVFNQVEGYKMQPKLF